MLKEPARLWTRTLTAPAEAGSAAREASSPVAGIAPGEARSAEIAAPPIEAAAGAPRNRSAATNGARRLVRASRRHCPLMIVLTAGLGLRVVTQLAYRPALLYIDSYKYLSGTSGYDPAGYNLLLKPLLWVGNLAVVAGFQHLLGLAMALALYTTLTRRGTPRWAATLATVPLLLDAYQLQMDKPSCPTSPSKPSSSPH